MNVTKSLLTLTLTTVGLLTLGAKAQNNTPFEHVLLISVDGMHAADLTNFVASHPNLAMAQLAAHGTQFPKASSALPSDSFPGLLALVTGGSPKSTGVYYDVSYDRSLAAPGSDCKVLGSEMVFDESIDINMDLLNAGGGIDPKKLPLDPKKGCAPVLPGSFLKVNTIFEVAKAAGLTTAWSDKHPAYQLVQGPSGKGVDDLYVPEINNADSPTSNVQKTEAYDDLKVIAILNQISGKDSSGKNAAQVPAIFGMNFQAISVGQKLKGNGYTNAAATPSVGLNDALEHTDLSLGKMVAALKAGGMFEKTLIVLTAKHAQSPIDPALRKVVSDKMIPDLIDGIQKGLLVQNIQDTAGLFWLSDASKTAQVVSLLNKNKAAAGIQTVLSGAALERRFGPLNERRPDIMVIPQLGVIYASAKATKIAEHGGFSKDDSNVALLVSNPAFTARISKSMVKTAQVAPTILMALGLDPNKLQAVQLEGTKALPMLLK